MSRRIGEAKRARGDDRRDRAPGSDLLEEGIRYQRESRDEGPAYYHRLITDEVSVRNQFDGGEGTEFVTATDFTQSFVPIVQIVMQTARWVELRRIERVEGGLDVDVTTASPDWPYGDDAAVHSLAIRVTDERSEVPAELAVTVDGESSTP